MTRIREFIVLLACLVCGVRVCCAFEATCPPDIYTHQQLAVPVADWEQFSRDPWGAAGDPGSESPVSRSGFSHIEVYEGSPKELGDLVPDNEKSAIGIWSLGRPGETRAPLFMACVYEGTYVRLVRKLPDSVTKCHVKKNGALNCLEATH